MKGLELNVTKQNGMTLVEYQLGAADVYDDRVSDKVAQLGNIIPFQYKVGWKEKYCLLCAS